MQSARGANFWTRKTTQANSKRHYIQYYSSTNSSVISSGCSPLHYASREGHIRSLENLIRLGACINLKNNNNESPLHFAARYGRYNTVKQLLDSEKGTFIINECDGTGGTPLHIASQVWVKNDINVVAFNTVFYFAARTLTSRAVATQPGSFTASGS